MGIPNTASIFNSSNGLTKEILAVDLVSLEQSHRLHHNKFSMLVDLADINLM